MTNGKPIVSVAIAAHNHEKFIAKAIDGVLMQQVNFDYELIVCDDASTDKTNAILLDYQRKNPKKINLIIADKNEGAWKSGKKLYEQCNGKYVTWLDGDDYWNYDQKLQKQVDFLEANSDYAGCFHDAEIVTSPENGTDLQANNQLLNDCDKYSQFNEYRSDFYPWHLLQRNIIPTASLLFRNTHDLSFFEHQPNSSLSLNWALHLHLIKSSKFKYFNEAWSIYNDHPGGVSKTHSLNSFKHANIAILKNLLKDEYYWEFKKGIYQSIANEYLQILLNPDTIKESKSEYYKASINYLISCFRTVVHLMKYYRQPKEK